MRLDRVLAIAQKLRYMQVLLDPLEEQLDLPAAFVQSCNGQGWQGRVVCQADQSLRGFWVLGFAKRRPAKQTKTQIDCGGIQSVDRLLDFELQVLIQIKLESAPDHNCDQVGPDLPVARIFGIGQDGAVIAVAKSYSVQLAGVGSQSHFDLRERGRADIHRKSPGGLNLGNYTGMRKRVSNRHQIKLTFRPCQY